MSKIVRFDWAIKKLLRHKANFGILEGFLSELLKIDIKIESILESEGNKQNEYDKYNRVDILVKTENNELMLVEVQNDSEVDYFQRMIYGTSKLVTEYIKEGEPYGTIKKIVSVNIVYFGLGQGEDYIYEYKGNFVGVHLGDILQPSLTQTEAFKIAEIAELFPRYFIIKVNNFNDIAKDTLDEWIYVLKNSEVKSNFKAKGLDEVKEKLEYEKLAEEEKQTYNRFMENRRIERSVKETTVLESRLEERLEIARKMKIKNVDVEFIAEITNLPVEEIENLS